MVIAYIDINRKLPSSDGLIAERPIELGEVLHSVVGRLPDGRPETIPEPLIPLLDTTLLTNAPGEPRVGHQVLTEIDSADRIDVVMAFIRRSGIASLMPALSAHCAAGRDFRVLTTTYTGSTEARALNELQDIGAEIRVSYDTSGTRLHAKAWLLHRQSGFSTAYIGSSNLTYSAQISGLEWNVRISGARNPDVIDKVAADFESYWHNPDFRPYDREEFRIRAESSADSRATVLMSPTDLRPEPFQERLLEQIALSRQQGHHRNLLVSATGTGKTVMAAIDYLGLREALPRARLLFVAHREEILTQSRATFQQALRDPLFGELWVGGHRPEQFEFVFASIQSLNASGLAHLDASHFDIVIVDEFHHAAAQSYQMLLEHVRPVELLGLTATPERSDGLPILDWFGGRIAAELRLWDAIDQQRLVAFVYYGIYDGLDLRDIPWRRGRGYDVEGLSNLLTANDALAKFVLKELEHRIDDLARMRALGFCVSVEHARFMARLFRAAGVAATAIWSDTPELERRSALADLASRRVNVVFSVDLFNEGVDVPAVDTLLMLRPTDSPTLFLQQLGRGLRRSVGKTVCTVLDFVGHHRKEFRFDRRFRALLGGTRKELTAQVEAGFPFLPAGCHIELDRVAASIVLESIKNAVPSRWTERVEALRQLTAQRSSCTLARYLEETGLELDDVYVDNKSWSDLRADAGLSDQSIGSQEVALRRACGRLLHVDDMLRISAYRRFLESPQAPDIANLSPREQHLLRMLVGSLVPGAVSKDTPLGEGAALLWSHPHVRAELLDLLEVLANRIEHVPIPLSTHVDVPLEVHARYTRVEILAAFDVGEGAKVAPWQTGVYWASNARADLFAFTLDKTTGQFSPTTRYRDYAISPDLVHWESQSVTRADSETGRRYQSHVAGGSSVMLFARHRSDERAFYFLGPATYVKHESELPMAITWRLQHSLPGDLFAAFAAAVAKNCPHGWRMKIWVGVTDKDWFAFLTKINPDEVNFWQPSGSRMFRALQPGEPFLFKLHSPDNFVVGGGHFVRYSALPISLAWDAFGSKNGVGSLEELNARVRRYRREDVSVDPVIGCNVLAEPFFLQRSAWIPVPENWAPNIVQGKTYDTAMADGRALWNSVQTALADNQKVGEPSLSDGSYEQDRFGAEYLTRGRLGQGAFRVLVTDAYERRCAVTGEKTLPVLEAAHIKPYALQGPHRVSNGILLRSDMHKLFDIGYVTVTPDLRVEVSPRLKTEWQNGREYYAHHGQPLRIQPADLASRPGREFLTWHNENRFRA